MNRIYRSDEVIDLTQDEDTNVHDLLPLSSGDEDSDSSSETGGFNLSNNPHFFLRNLMFEETRRAFGLPFGNMSYRTNNVPVQRLSNRSAPTSVTDQNRRRQNTRPVASQRQVDILPNSSSIIEILESEDETDKALSNPGDSAPLDQGEEVSQSATSSQSVNVRRSKRINVNRR